MISLGFQGHLPPGKANPYVALDRDGLELHYFGIPGFLPEDSYGSCVVITDDIEALFDAFAAGLRAAYGKLPVSGFPRITRPRRRKNSGNRTGSAWSIRAATGSGVTAERSPVESPSDASVSRLRAAVDNAVVIADSHGDAAQAAKILAGALARDTTARPEERLEAEEYLAELRERVAELRVFLVNCKLLDLGEVQPRRDAKWLVEAGSTERYVVLWPSGDSCGKPAMRLWRNVSRRRTGRS